MADLYFFETVVRVHRAGEGAPYTGLKPAGLGHGPVIPAAEMGIDSGSSGQPNDLLAPHVRDEVRRRFDHLMELKPAAGQDVEHARELQPADGLPNGGSARCRQTFVQLRSVY